MTLSNFLSAPIRMNGGGGGSEFERSAPFGSSLYAWRTRKATSATAPACRPQRAQQQQQQPQKRAHCITNESSEPIPTRQQQQQQPSSPPLPPLQSAACWSHEDRSLWRRPEGACVAGAVSVCLCGCACVCASRLRVCLCDCAAGFV